MGYHAPRAEDVYRYIFRLDRQSGSTLSDGFSWSILFVNDSSPVCREFLARYGAELSYRTADRIRFVFFSGLSQEQTRSVIQSPQFRGSFLETLIRAATGWGPSRERFDWERSQWEMLRPEAFRPLESSERVRSQLSVECQMHSAMPGSKEALRLAQKLGIGRFVPCFLLFSDIGTPHVHLFPIANQSPEEVFNRLRSWVDSFFEINHSILTRWSAIEESIRQLVGRLRSSVDKVESWKRDREDAWRGLQQVAECLRQITDSQPDQDLLKRIGGDWTLPAEAHLEIRGALEQLQTIARRREQASRMTDWVAGIKAASAPAEIFGRLYRCEDAKALPPNAQTHLDEAINLFQPQMKPDSPEDELSGWWRSGQGRLPSRNQYEKYRIAWSEYSKRKHGETAPGNVASIIRDEFTVIVEAIRALAIKAEPDESAGTVIHQLTRHLGVHEDDQAWTGCVAEYRRSLTQYFQDARVSAPAWIVDFAHCASPPLTWGDCIPPWPDGQPKTRTVKQRLEQFPRLSELAEKVKRERDARSLELKQTRQLQRIECLQKLTREVEAWISSASLWEADRRSVWLALIEGLSSTRQHLEKRVFQNAKLAGQASYPGEKLSRDEISGFLRMLDEYSTAVQSLQFPFVNDPNVLRVALQTPLLDASGTGLNAPSATAKQQLRDAVERSDRSIQAWDSIRQQSAAASPAGKILSALSAVLPPDHLRNLVPEPLALSARRDLIAVLDALNVQELMALERKLHSEGSPPPASTKSGLYNSILLAVGIFPDAGGKPASPKDAKALREKLSKGAFDVFLAHNSQDKTDVLRLGQELRRHGIYPWIDVEQIPPGRWFQDVIQSAVRTVRAAAIVVGKSGFGQWQKLELRTFITRCIEQQIPLIPVLLPGATGIPDDWPFLRELDCVIFKDHIAEKDAVARLVWGITAQI